MIDQKTFEKNIIEAGKFLDKNNFNFDINYQTLLITNSVSKVAILVKRNNEDMEHPAILSELNNLKIYSYQLFAGMLNINNLEENDKKEVFNDLYQTFSDQSFVDETVNAIYNGDKIEAINALLMTVMSQLAEVKDENDYMQAISNYFSLHLVIKNILKQK